MSDEPVVAIGLLTQRHLDVLKDCLPQYYPIVEDVSFRDLLEALDKAETTRDLGEQ